MGIFDFGTPKEKRTQLYFRDDGKFTFRRLEIEDTFLVERNKDGMIIRGWKHFYNNQFPFGGYRNIAADMVTLSSGRDIVLDPYNLVPEKEKPGKVAKQAVKVAGQPPIVDWLVEVGNMRRLKEMSKRGKASTYDKIVLFLGTALMLEILIIGILVAANRMG